MKKLAILSYHTGLLFSAIALLSGCTSNQTDDDTPEPTPQITLTQNKQAIGSQGGPITIEVTSNVDYEVRLPDAPGWLQEVTSASQPAGIHQFEAEPNEEYDNRTTRIVFANDEFGVSQTFTLTQMQKNAILISEEKYTVEATGGALDFKINTNVDFQVAVSEEWIRQSPTRGLTEESLYFTVDPNPGDNSREAIITLTAEEVEQTVTILQLGRDGKSWLHIVHTNTTFRIPYFSGLSSVSGAISWGDGTNETYQETASHTYQKAGEHTVSIELQGADGFTFPDLVGISAIDMTQF